MIDFLESEELGDKTGGRSFNYYDYHFGDILVWLEQKILERDKAMRREGFEAGILTGSVPVGDGIRELVDYIDQPVYESFEDFEESRKNA